ncbi:hypothetical protein CITRIK5_60127 [Citricoccus sp. K5]|nr:hypothetical protein CITRIK5_60127 [Citricoccus sp. K5]
MAIYWQSLSVHAIVLFTLTDVSVITAHAEGTSPHPS